MRALQIDFAKPTLWRTLARTSALTWSLLAVGLIALLIVGIDLRKTMQARQIIEQAMANASAQRAKRSQSSTLPAPILSPVQIAGLNGVIDQLNVPWRDLLDAIESATPPAIALLSLEPDARRRTLVGSAEARDSEAMIDYLSALQQQPFFSGVMLLRHETNEQDARKPLRFQFEASWHEAAP